MSDEARLDREVVARIISRAAASAGPERLDVEEVPAGGLDGIDEAALIEAAREVGLPAVAVRRAIAVERLGVRSPDRLADRLLGRSVLSVDDEITGSADDVLARVDAWLVDGHHLRRDRLRGGRGEWSKRSGLVGTTVRRVRVATGEGQLGEHRRVTAAAHDIGSGSAVVRVEVDRSSDRLRSAAGGLFVALGGTTGIVVAAAASAPLILVATPLAIAGGIGVAMTGRGRATRTAVEVERLLGAVADREAPTKLRNEVARRVTGRRSTSRRGRTSPPFPDG